jgi:hypothetical protein
MIPEIRQRYVRTDFRDHETEHSGDATTSMIMNGTAASP